MYNPNMEVQVNVAQDCGTRVEGDFEGKRWLAWTDGIQIWKPIRIPRNANTEPVYDDKPMAYNLDEHAEAIGMTGWDWKNKQSCWLAYDFDAITGHSEKHKKKLTDLELNEIKKELYNIPWTTIRLSTSGKGLHLYVFITPTPTNTHTEHAALARSVLHLLSGLTGCDFNSKVDVCGGNMWVWHRKMVGTPGLTLEKQGTILTDIPPNWRDHVRVSTGKTRRNLPQFVQDNLEGDEGDIERTFNELTGQRSKVRLDSNHRALLDYLAENKCFWWWDNDHHMLVTHTIHLKEAHVALGLKGQFETNAVGANRGFDHNSFCFPLPFGAWAIRRYGLGTGESSCWEQDGKGWTRCYYNREIDLPTAARTLEGIEHPNGGWTFKEAKQAETALIKLGADIALPAWIVTRSTRIKAHQKEPNKVIVEIPEETHDKSEDMKGWLKEKGWWKRVFLINIIRSTESDVGINSDDVIRHLVSSEGADHGWMIKAESRWNNEPYQHVQVALASMGFSAKDTKEFLGAQIFQPWKLVNIPFNPEYPGDRQWNRDSAQLRFLPNPDLDNLTCPTWNRMLEHIGSGLDDAIKENEWCVSNGIIRGSEYLKCWIASMFKEPTEPLPYLFLWSQDQNTGKSILHEALCLLLTRGYTRVDHALANQSGFNGEMENSVLGVIEEINLKQNAIAYNRIKDWVTSKTISIHKKSKTPYLAINCIHFIQTANDPTACPIFPGDTRITMIEVRPLDVIIPKKQMLILLEKEASDFISEIMKLELPVSNDRLNIPIVHTSDKGRAEESHENELDVFIREICHAVPGEVIPVSELWERFKEWLDPNSVHKWSKIMMGKAMPSKFPKGRLTTDSSIHYGNISFSPAREGVPHILLKEMKNVLRKVGEA